MIRPERPTRDVNNDAFHTRTYYSNKSKIGHVDMSWDACASFPALSAEADSAKRSAVCLQLFFEAGNFSETVRPNDFDALQRTLLVNAARYMANAC
jgi:hypothetical protein